MYDENKLNELNGGEGQEAAGERSEKRSQINNQSYPGDQSHFDGQNHLGNQNQPDYQNRTDDQNHPGYQNRTDDQNQSGYRNQPEYQSQSASHNQQESQGQGDSQNSRYSSNTQNTPNTQNTQSRSPYSSPYPYTDNNYQSQETGSHSRNTSPGGSKKPRKNSFMKTTAMVTAGALLFGVVAGGTMFGVNRAGELLFPSAKNAPAPLENTQTVPAAQPSSTEALGGAVIEDVSSIVEAAMPSVVAITNTMLYQSNTWFGPSQTYEVPNSGSGIIVSQNDSELLIVTNNHVIEGATSLQVTFIDESTVEAAVKGTDSESDLAVIAVPLENISADTKSQIKAATLGDSDALKMGQGVIAIGNALGHGQSVTVGHVSALNREIQVDGVKKTVIQTDAAINPGNSGGALLNAKGELIGINEAKYASTEVEGVGYAIPISYAWDIIEDLKSRTTKIEVAEENQGYLGIQVRNTDAQTAEMFGMPRGVYVYKIMEDSAAAGSDLREKDIITKFDGETVRTNADLTELLTYYKAGSTVTLTVQSLENGQYVERQVEVTLKNRPKEEEQDNAQKQE